MLKTIYLFITMVFAGDLAWVYDKVPTPLQYTSKNEVAVIYNTKIDLNEFLEVLKTITNIEG